MRALLARGSKVDVKTKDNYTALHLAVEYGKATVVEALLGAGASVHIKGMDASKVPLLRMCIVLSDWIIMNSTKKVIFGGTDQN